MEILIGNIYKDSMDRKYKVTRITDDCIHFERISERQPTEYICKNNNPFILPITNFINSIGIAWTKINN